MKRQRHTVKELMDAKREAHRLVAEKLRNETFYQASGLTMKFILGIINDHRQKGMEMTQAQQNEIADSLDAIVQPLRHLLDALVMGEAEQASVVSLLEAARDGLNGLALRVAGRRKSRRRATP